jgi:hypothetical protein
VELGRKEEEAENKVCRITEGSHLVVWLSDTTEVLTAALLACLAQCLEPEEAHYLAQETGGPSWQVRGKNIVYQDKVDMTPQKPNSAGLRSQAPLPQVHSSLAIHPLPRMPSLVETDLLKTVQTPVLGHRITNLMVEHIPEGIASSILPPPEVGVLSSLLVGYSMSVSLKCQGILLVRVQIVLLSDSVNKEIHSSEPCNLQALVQKNNSGPSFSSLFLNYSDGLVTL